MRIGLDTRAPNGPESRALRTMLHLERRNLTQIVNAQRLLGSGRCQNDDLKAWEAGEGYPPGLLKLLSAFDAAVSRLAISLFTAGLRPDGVCDIVRPAATELAAFFPVHEFGLVLDAECQAMLMRDGGDIWQRLFDAVVDRVAELSERRGARLTVSSSVGVPVAQDGGKGDALPS